MIMLDSLKQTRIGHEIGRAWDNLAEGWREMFSRGSNALTQFVDGKEEQYPKGSLLAPFPRWSLLAGEVEETDKEIVVRLELPGMRKEDCQITVDGNMLYVSGEKHAERSSHDSTYHVTERAYGSFQRTIALPRNVFADQASACYKNGVMTIRLPKASAERSHAIRVA
jgi:HSP20 family protein